MAINRVDYGDETLIDLTQDTVTPQTLAAGYTAHGADGNLIQGQASFGEGGGSDSIKLEYTFTEEDFELLMEGEELPIEFTKEQQAEFETELTAFANGKNV